MKAPHGRHQHQHKKARAAKRAADRDWLNGFDVEVVENGGWTCRAVCQLRTLVLFSLLINVAFSIHYFVGLHQLRIEEHTHHEHETLHVPSRLHQQITNQVVEKAERRRVRSASDERSHLEKRHDDEDDDPSKQEDDHEEGHTKEEETHDQDDDPGAEHKIPIAQLLTTDFEVPREACVPCTAKAHGFIPTTLQRRYPAVEDCIWIKRSRTFLAGYAMKLAYVMSMDEAKELCLRLGPQCTGLTCEGSKCTARAGVHLVDSHGEDTYLKDCPDTRKLDQACNATFGYETRALRGKADSSDEDKVESPDLSSVALVVLGHDRDDELKSCLLSLGALRDIPLFDLIVSLDDPQSEDTMRSTIQEVESMLGVHITTWRIDVLETHAVPDFTSEAQIKFLKTPTAKIAHHYHMAFQKVFEENDYRYGIFVEEDLVFSPDFLALFRSTSWLLEKDESLWCVSGWNDYGFYANTADSCRLRRTSYFPGLGFLLTRAAWEAVGPLWTMAPTMGWDYWMRVAFRDFGKECIIPEIPRSHHNTSTKGSSVTLPKQFKLFKAMALAEMPNSCTLSAPCRQFGDINYLIEEEYDKWLRDTLQHADIHPSKEMAGGSKSRLVKKPDRGIIVVPYLHEEYVKMLDVFGLQPKETNGAIPQDVRGEHYGVSYGRHMPSQQDVILVDRRNKRNWLRPPDQQFAPADMTVVAAPRHTSCMDACQEAGRRCKPAAMHYVNSCALLKKHFPCEGGCAHQVGQELPAYVVDEKQPTRQQCLVTFISKMTCAASHASTRRLCACI
mmetsp:Transcript_17669/g.40943  ORF Transcript_17669/g.40943 Transcript_17669/m.40943 type:complete len:785 (+) Transcript_17669:26-2380(+)